jgi:toxin-antitoxin system PIN domain toxin
LILPDVNVVIYAHRQDAQDHRRFRAWLEDVVNADEAFAMSELVLSGFVRIVTNRRIFRPPSSLQAAFTFCEQLLAQPGCVPVRPGPRHWSIFLRLCRESGARGPLVPDAYFAALAIESGCEWITTDRDFARFKGLRWRHPLA